MTGLVTDASQNWAVMGRMMRAYNTTAPGAALRMGILLSVIFPLATFISHIAISRLEG